MFAGAQVDREHIMKVFKEFDADNSGSLNYAEFQKGLIHMDVNCSQDEFDLLTTEIDNGTAT